ncbi:lantibiotic dehydratase [Streptomyces sp. NRRL S-87]|uniref:lantibiotic dehydratase n=1 Tax=Streptomyces sp. NRRL S-87 TaxID=1463920 RepID=UPI00068D269C|nr:lantibiotic dehydratase [Streptomyces sp. NRRL S-87]
MPHSAPTGIPGRVPHAGAGAHAAPDPPDGPGMRDAPEAGDRTARHALVRTTVLPYPAETAPAAAVRALLARLTALAAEDGALRAALSDDLFAARAGHGEDFHRRVVLPLRRALHNGRTPRPALLDRLDDLPVRVPRLADWLALRERRARLLDELADAVPPALGAERAALAALCRSPAFTRAVALTSADLLRAVTRTGGAADHGGTGRRARKEEAAVLRHALRAGTKTSPLSWFTAVGWTAGPPAAGGPPQPPTGAVPLAATVRESRALVATVRESRALVAALTAALLDEPRRRRAVPHRLTSSARVVDGRARYARAETLFAGGRYLVTREDEVEVAARPALAALAAALETGPLPLGPLTARLADGLGRAADDPAVAGFVDRLAAAGLLVPADPVDPQHATPLEALADWLHQWPEDAPVAARVARLAHDTRGFTAAPAAERPALLAALARRWHELLAGAGRPVPADAAPLTVLSEDVTAPALLPASRPSGPPSTRRRTSGAPYEEQDHLPAGYDPPGPADRAALAELSALAELFDLGHVMRRAARDRFVARYGPGGTCRDPWDFGADTAAAWEDAGRLAGRPSDDPGLSGDLRGLALLREEFVSLAHTAARPGDDPAGVPADEVVLPAGQVRALAARLPDWTAARPLDYAYFLQRDPDARLLCVNHVYGGWGRFTSRFLDALPPAAAAAVADRIRHGLGEGVRAAQIRPVGGFNANLHPLLLADEIGPDRRWTSLAETDVALVHDPDDDQLRFRVRSSGDPIDVLYLGFLAPVMLPRRLGPFLADHPEGVVDFSPLLPRHTVAAPGGRVVRTPRLRHRHLVLARRRWHLDAGVLEALRADLSAADGEVPAEPVARWRALLHLPEQLFLHPAPAAPSGHAVDDFVTRLRAPKPQGLDLGNALHLRCLAGWLARHPRGVVLEEALPSFGGRPRPGRAVELVAETYRPARARTTGRTAPRAERAGAGRRPADPPPASAGPPPASAATLPAARTGPRTAAVLPPPRRGGTR